jgi:hypothetical protein
MTHPSLKMMSPIFLMTNSMYARFLKQLFNRWIDVLNGVSQFRIEDELSPHASNLNEMKHGIFPAYPKINANCVMVSVKTGVHGQICNSFPFYDILLFSDIYYSAPCRLRSIYLGAALTTILPCPSHASHTTANTPFFSQHLPHNWDSNQS